MTGFNDRHVTATYHKAATCPHCEREVAVTIELDRAIVALTTILSGFYETPRDFDIETCIDEGLDELDKRTKIHVGRRAA